MIDLTPAAIGPYCVPVVNLESNLDEGNVNLVTCGGQATIPMVSAVNSVSKVRYAEIVASVSSSSAGPGTRANIDEFTQTTALGLEKVGGAEKAKAIIIKEKELFDLKSPEVLMPSSAPETSVEEQKGQTYRQYKDEQDEQNTEAVKSWFKGKGFSEEEAGIIINWLKEIQPKNSEKWLHTLKDLKEADLKN